MKFPLAGKSVLITGASGGLGAALAAECAKRGARLALASRSLKALRRPAERVQGRTYSLDVNKTASVKSQ